MYSRKLGDRTIDFGHEGLLYRNSFVLYDRGTRSLWIHTTGQAVKGQLRGAQLEFLPSEILPWGAWLDAHPRSLVLDRTGPKGTMGSFGLPGDGARYGLSLGQGRTTKLYPFPVLMEELVVNDTFDGKNVLVVYDPNTTSARAWLRGGRTFRWSDDALVDDRGVVWDALKGTSSRKGDEPLERLVATAWLESRWSGFYPKGEIYEP